MPFLLHRTYSLAGSVALLGVSVTPANATLPGGCSVLIDQPLIVSASANGRGAITFAMPLPASPALRGADVFAQAAAIDSGGAFAGLLALSGGLRMRID